MKKPAVFLDRDGTINEQMGYLNHRDRLVLLPRVGEAIKLLNQHDFLVIIISNQSGVARGYFPIALVHEIHALLQNTLMEQGALIDGIYFCPHHAQGAITEYALKCDCRKPKTGLIQQACREFEIDLTRSCVIGDMHTDMELAAQAGLKGIMVKTGYGRGEIEYILPQKKIKPIYIAEDLLEAAQWILKIGAASAGGV